MPEKDKQTSVYVDDVHFKGVDCLHVVDKCIGWSEATTLQSRKLSDQAIAFTRIWVHRHGVPRRVYGDAKYAKGDFKAMFTAMGIEFVPIAANDHEANGTMESANRVLRNFVRCERSCKAEADIAAILEEAVYGKNMCKGSKLASYFELLYSRRPRVMNGVEVRSSPAITIEEHVKDVAKRGLQRMQTENTRDTPKVQKGDWVYFWRDLHRWIGPARVVGVQDSVITLVHDELTKNSSLNYVQKTVPPVLDIHEVEEAPQQLLPQYRIYSGYRSACKA